MSTASDYIPKTVAFISGTLIVPDPQDILPLWVVDAKKKGMINTRLPWAERGSKTWRRWWGNQTLRSTFVDIVDNRRPIQSQLIPIGFTRWQDDSGLTLLIDNKYKFETSFRFLEEIATGQGIRLGVPLSGQFAWWTDGREGCEPFLLDGPTAQSWNLSL